MQHPKIVRRPRPVRRSCDDAYEVDGTDFLARTVYEDAPVGPIGFVHFKAKESPMAGKKCSGKKGGKGKK